MKTVFDRIIEKQIERRNFNVERYIVDKIAQLNIFFSTNNIDSVVVGVSGGVDSAVTLCLLKMVGNLDVIVPVIAPIFGEGTSGQNEATRKAQLICDHLKLTPKVVDLTKAYESIVTESNTEDGWAKGQMASVLRTPLFYLEAANLQVDGYRSIVVGTTNRDEGSYIGFFGKASDGMVDLQPIADIHKDEVYQLANYFNVPEDIIDSDPKGDVFDERIDVEMIGASYEFLKKYILLIDASEDLGVDISDLMKIILFTDDEHAMIRNIEELHEINKHKYEVGAPSHFVDVLKRKVKGGWS